MQASSSCPFWPATWALLVWSFIWSLWRPAQKVPQVSGWETLLASQRLRRTNSMNLHFALIGRRGIWETHPAVLLVMVIFFSIKGCLSRHGQLLSRLHRSPFVRISFRWASSFGRFQRCAWRPKAFVSLLESVVWWLPPRILCGSSMHGWILDRWNVIKVFIW